MSVSKFGGMPVPGNPRKLGESWSISVDTSDEAWYITRSTVHVLEQIWYYFTSNQKTKKTLILSRAFRKVAQWYQYEASLLHQTISAISTPVNGGLVENQHKDKFGLSVTLTGFRCICRIRHLRRHLRLAVPCRVTKACFVILHIPVEKSHAC